VRPSLPPSLLPSLPPFLPPGLHRARHHAVLRALQVGHGQAHRRRRPLDDSRAAARGHGKNKLPLARVRLQLRQLRQLLLLSSLLALGGGGAQLLERREGGWEEDGEGIVLGKAGRRVGGHAGKGEHD